MIRKRTHEGQAEDLVINLIKIILKCSVRGVLKNTEFVQWVEVVKGLFNHWLKAIPYKIIERYKASKDFVNLFKRILSHGILQDKMRSCQIYFDDFAYNIMFIAFTRKYSFRVKREFEFILFIILWRARDGFCSAYFQKISQKAKNDKVNIF